MSGATKNSRETELKAQILWEKRDKKDLRGKVMLGLICALGVIYGFDKFGLDSALYFLVGGIDSVIGPDNPWLPEFKASLGTLLPYTFVGVMLAAVYTAKQES
jgi:hypothetical protein